EDDRVDGAEVHAEDRRVVEQRRGLGPGVEEQRAPLVADVRREQQREAVVRAAGRGPRQLRQTTRREQPRPFLHDVLRGRGEAVGRVVDEDQDVEAVDRAQPVHRAGQSLRSTSSSIRYAWSKSWRARCRNMMKIEYALYSSWRAV